MEVRRKGGETALRFERLGRSASSRAAAERGDMRRNLAPLRVVIRRARVLGLERDKDLTAIPEPAEEAEKGTADTLGRRLR